MKIQSLASILSFGLLLGSLVATTAGADDRTVTTTTKTTSYSGVVSNIDAGASTIILKSDASPEPTTYSFTKETTFVDPTGKVVSYESMRGAPVTVEYETDGGRMVVRKVVQTGPAVVVPGAPQVQRKVTETQRTVTTD